MTGPYDIFSEYYDQAYADGREDALALFAPVLDPWVQGARSICDIGCGTATLAIALSKLRLNSRPPFSVTAVDRHPGMLRVARRKARQAGAPVRFVQADMRCVSPQTLRGAPFDAVVCFFDTLNHLECRRDLLPVFINIYSILKPGGAFVFDMNTPRGVAFPWPDPPAVFRGFQRKGGRPGRLHYIQIASALPYQQKSRSGGTRFEWFLQKSARPAGAAAEYQYFREDFREIAWSQAEVHSALRKAGFAVKQEWDGSVIERGLGRGLRVYTFARKVSGR